MEEFAGNSGLECLQYTFDKKSLTRRIFWVLLSMGAVAGLVLLMVIRVRYFFSHPYLEQSSTVRDAIPVPAMLICASMNDDFIKNKTFESKVTDKDFLFSSTLYFPIKGLTKIANNHLIFNVNAAQKANPLFSLLQGLVKDYSTGNEVSNMGSGDSNMGSGDYNMGSGYDYSTPSTPSEGTSSGNNEQQFFDLFTCGNNTNEICMPYEDFMILYANEKKFRRLLETLQRISKITLGNSDVITREDYTQFALNSGLRKDKHVSACNVKLGVDSAICMKEIKEVVSDGQGCLTLERWYNGTALDFSLNTKSTLVRNNIAFGLVEFPEDMWDTSLYIFTEGEIWTRHLSTDERFSPGSRTLQLNSKKKKKQLPAPFHTTDCSDQMNSGCIVDCMKTTLDCDMFYFSKSSESSTRPFCTLYDQIHGPMDVINQCNIKCQDSCVSIFNEIQVTSSAKVTGVTYAQEYHVQLVASRQLRYEISEEFDAYSWDALFAEVGGMMGLLLGASVLTLVHVLENTLDIFAAALAKAMGCGKHKVKTPREVRQMQMVSLNVDRKDIYSSSYIA